VKHLEENLRKRGERQKSKETKPKLGNEGAKRQTRETLLEVPGDEGNG